MTQYIDKAAVITELEKRRSRNSKNKLNLAAAFEDNYLLSFIDTLEVIDPVALNEIEDAHYDGYMCAEKAIIEKACEWLYLQLNEINMEGEDMENFLKDFKNYMKGE